MNLNTVREVKQPRSADEIAKWRDGYAWLAGGTWLFSTPQIATDTLIDLRSLRWPALQASNTGLDIAATCTIAELYNFQAPAEWTAAPLFRLCARAFLASFKIWNAATVGGNICMSLPAGPMVTLATALEARYTLLPRDAAPREVAAIDFVTGNHANVLKPGELLRNIDTRARFAQVLRLAPLLAHPSWPVRRVPHRHAERRRRRSPIDHHRRHSEADADQLRSRPGGSRASPRD
jgi:CO/xanthine dehydrogenase FAD-binding subunit